MDKLQIERKRQAERDARRLFNKKYRAKTEEKEIELPVGLNAKHKFDIYEYGKFIGGITTSPWKNKTGSNNTGGQDRASTELLWLTLWEGKERRVMVLTDREMADRLWKRWRGCAFSHQIEIIHYNSSKEHFETVGIL